MKIKPQILSVIIVIGIYTQCFAQKPILISIDKTNGPLNSLVTISGSDFGSDPSDLRVFFGGAIAEIIQVSNQLLVVKVPSGATFDNIAVTKLSSGLTGYSSASFFVNFGGEGDLTADAFSPQLDFNATPGLYDFCLCDFNNDGKTDVVAASDNSNTISFFQNGSSLGTISLSGSTTLINAKTVHITCGDLNGDGLADVVLSEAEDGSRLFPFKNNGGFSFTALPTITLAGRKVKRVAISDLDLDGKPELIISDKSTSSNSLILLPNTSTSSTISFGNLLSIPVPAEVGDFSTDALEIKDINANGLPDIITSQFLDNSNKIFVLNNHSSPGIFDFNDITTLSLTGTAINVKVGDLDGDSKSEIVVTRFLNQSIAIFKNQSSNAISFASPVFVETVVNPWGLDLGDLNGDGKLDIAVASNTVKTISYLENQGTAGNISFKPRREVSTSFINRHIRIADMDIDGKPDLVFTSIDDNNNSIPASKISIKRNSFCFLPKVSPEGPQTICSGFEVELTSSAGGGVAYEWKRDNVTIVGETEQVITVSQSGVYTVTAYSESNSCIKTSNPVALTVAAPGAGLSPGDPNARSNSPVCTESTLELEVSDVGASEYRWKGPNNFSAIGRIVSIPDFSVEMSGLYIVEMISGTCVAKIDSTIVESVSNPDFSVTYTGSELFCAGDAKTLSVSPVFTSGFSYQWFEDTQGELSGETDLTLNATTSGSYYAVVTSDFVGCDPVETPSVQITNLMPIDANFSSSTAEACTGQEIIFTSTSTFDQTMVPEFNWKFGDTKTAIGTEVSTIYNQAGPFNVTLTVSYAGGVCSDEHELPVTITQGPSVLITAPDNIFQVCENDTLRLGVSGDTFIDYVWSTGETTPTLLIDQGSTYSVTVTTESGCILEVEKTIQEIPTEEVVILVDGTPVSETELLQIQVGEDVLLNATGGLTNILWQPGLSLSDSTIASPIASPLQDVIYTVSGKDFNGCSVKGSIQIRVNGSSPLNLVKPKKYFSPNGDSENQFWTIDNILSFPQCIVTIYNDKGAKVFEAKPYNNDWEGTMKGRELPAGVYYYVIQCDGTNDRKTGPITLLK